MSDDDLSASALMELWLGPSPFLGSAFETREQLQDAWVRGRDRVMALFGTPGRRPQGWWEFEAGALKYPGLEAEAAVLYEAGLLGKQERAELEAEWRAEYDKARGFKDAAARRVRLKWAGVPRSLIKAWKAERRRPVSA
jgi:hypothetical protein